MDQTRYLPLILSLGCLLSVSIAQAEINLPPQLSLQSSTLNRCSQAELTAFSLIHVGNAGLYLENCSAKPDIFSEQAKQLRFVYERDIPANAFQEASMTYLKKNLGAQFSAWETLYQHFNSHYRAVKTGDYYDLQYTPNNGLSLSLNGKLLGTINDPSAALAYLNVWFGAEPFSDKLKHELLSISKP